MKHFILEYFFGVINGLQVNISNLSKYPNVKISTEPPEYIKNRQFVYLIVGTVNRIKMRIRIFNKRFIMGKSKS